jgi:hypothetical protein
MLFHVKIKERKSIFIRSFLKKMSTVIQYIIKATVTIARGTYRMLSVTENKE